MAATDFNSSQPVRTESPGDVKAIIVDPTTPSQGLGIDAAGKVTVKLDDAAGNGLTSETLNSKQYLDTVAPSNVANGAAIPGYSNLMAGSDGTLAHPLKVDLSGRAVIALNDGAGNSITQGQKTMALSLPVVIASDQNDLGVKLKDGADNSITSTAINSKQRLDVNNASEGTNGAAVPFQTTQVGGSDGTNLHALKTNTAGQLQAAIQDSTGAAITTSNPLPVVISANVPGTPVNNYFVSTANVAANGSDTHLYTITASKTFQGKKFTMSASGRARFDIQISTNGTTFVTVFTVWTTASCPTIQVDMGEISIADTGTGSAVQIVRYNEDKQPFGLYSTICGVEQ